jgi:23S rRNA pseudouridine1911/1915/1917 synthase
MGFKAEDILYEDNHLLVVNKQSGQLVQADLSGDVALEDDVKAFIKVRDNKPGNVFLGVVHRIDRPVSGVILFAKSKKALVRMNEMMKKRALEKHYWAITENRPSELEALLVHQIIRDGKTNKSYIVSKPKCDSKEARLKYKVLNTSDRYTLLDVELMTGRHHQIRCQLSKIGCPIRGDLKYGAKRSLPDGSISLHSRSLTFIHPVRGEQLTVVAPVPGDDNLWQFFENNTN